MQWIITFEWYSEAQRVWVKSQSVIINKSPIVWLSNMQKHTDTLHRITYVFEMQR